MVIPDNEFKRLEALFKLKILGTENEEVYDTIVELTSSIMETPMAAISLIADDYQWAKSIKGSAVTKVPREHSFSTIAIKNPDQILIINDTLLDKRFEKNPNVIGPPHARYIVCVPLISNGEPIGALVAGDNVPRDNPTDHQLSEMKAVAKLTIAQLELREFIIDFYERFNKMKNISKDFTIINNSDLNIISIYKDLNSKCDEVLSKIKANKSKEN